MSLFSSVARTDTSHRAPGEPTLAFYDRAAGPYWDDLRHLLEDWFSRVADTDQLDLGGRLRSDDDRQFDGAFHELYLHESLLRMGYTLTIHPTLLNSNKHTDFLAEKNGRSFYLEAGSARPSDDAIKSAARISQVHDYLNKMDSANFRFGVDVVAHAKQTPKPGPLRKEVANWTAELNPDDCLLRADAGLADLPRMTFDREGWVIELTAIGRPAEQRGSPTARNVYLSWDDQVWIDEGGIAKALETKGSAYGELDAPFVVAVTTGSMGVTDGDIAGLLYGTGHWARDAITDKYRLTRRDPNGYWLAGDQLRHRGVSAVLVTPLLRMWDLPSQRHTIWVHPDPDFTVDELPMWRRATYDNGLPAFVEPQRTHGDWFELGDDWPTGEPYPRES